MKRALLILLAALAAAPAAAGGGPRMLVGAADDVITQPDAAQAQRYVGLGQAAGLDTIRIAALWSPGQTALPAGRATEIGNAVAAAKAAQVRIVLSLYPFGSSVTPLTDADRADFVAWVTDVVRRFPYVHDFVVGNEPNLNRFWMPQFGPSGEDLAAPAYEQLLAQSYDAIKAVRPHSTVYGGALAPRGVDRPNTGRDTHSPMQFVLDLGAAYRASGREIPIMDAFAFHPYPESANIPPDFQHPNSTAIGIADYDKLVSLLGQAFDGTAQRGSSLPILYDEFGVESQIPAAKEPFYTGTEPATIHPVDEATQAAYYRQALQLVFCQPNVLGLLMFDFVDEKPHAGWQSGLYYADGTPKTSLAPVREAIAETHRGVVAQCPALQVTPKLTVVPKLLPRRKATVTIASDVDARYAISFRGGAVARGTVVGGVPRVLHYTLRPGRYQWTITATALQNAGAPASAVSRPLRVS